jgi:hypothetical protein
MKQKIIVYTLIAAFALPVLLQSCATKKCGCQQNLNYTSKRR